MVQGTKAASGQDSAAVSSADDRPGDGPGDEDEAAHGVPPQLHSLVRLYSHDDDCYRMPRTGCVQTLSWSHYEVLKSDGVISVLGAAVLSKLAPCNSFSALNGSSSQGYATFIIVVRYFSQRKCLQTIYKKCSGIFLLPIYI